MKVWAKVENDEVTYPPYNDFKTGMFNVHKNVKWLTENGYSEWEQKDLWEIQKKNCPKMPQKYSTLKIIRTLGDQWNTYRQLLEKAGCLDQFFAANYLAEDDPVFEAFMATVPEDVKAMLEQCIWEEN